MLLRAYGPRGASLGDRVDAAEAVRLAQRFWLGGRIAARQGKRRLVAELGEASADELVRDLVASCGIELFLERVLERVAEVAAGRGVPFVLLKYGALRWSPELGVDTRAVGRAAGDIDLLVAPERAAELQAALVEAGFDDPGFTDSPHHLPVLTAPEGRHVEVHRHLAGVRLDGARSAGFDELARADLLVRVEGIEGDCLAPVRDVVVAHLVAHGLVQHGLTPHGYPLGRLFGDLIELGLAGEGGRAPGGNSERWRRWVARDLETDSVNGLLSLCRWLAAGRVANEEAPSGRSARRLLDHFLAGRLDGDYAAALRLENAWAFRGDEPLAMALPQRLVRALVPTRAALEKIYGPGGGRWRYLGLRLLRPFDLVRRWMRYRGKRAALKRRSD